MATEPTISGMEALHVNKNNNMFRLPFPSLLTLFRSRSRSFFLKASGYGISQPVFQICRASKDAGIVLPILQTIAPSKPISSTSAKQLRDQPKSIENIPSNKSLLNLVKGKSHTMCSFEPLDTLPDSNSCLVGPNNNVFSEKDELKFNSYHSTPKTACLDPILVAENCEKSSCMRVMCLNASHGSVLPTNHCTKSVKTSSAQPVCSNAPKIFGGSTTNPECAPTVRCNAPMNKNLLPARARKPLPARTTRPESLARNPCCTSSVCFNASEKVACCNAIMPSSCHAQTASSWTNAHTHQVASCKHNVCKNDPKKTTFHNSCMLGVCQNATMTKSCFFNYTRCIKTTDPPINMNDESTCSTKMPFLFLNWFSRCLLLLLNFGVLHHVWIGNFLFLPFYLNVLMDLLVYFPSAA